MSAQGFIDCLLFDGVAEGDFLPIKWIYSLFTLATSMKICQNQNKWSVIAIMVAKFHVRLSSIGHASA